MLFTGCAGEASARLSTIDGCSGFPDGVCGYTLCLDAGRAATGRLGCF
jgi:hypothetical protein